jgi:hypothetical protein
VAFGIAGAGGGEFEWLRGALMSAPGEGGSGISPEMAFAASLSRNN